MIGIWAGTGSSKETNILAYMDHHSTVTLMVDSTANMVLGSMESRKGCRE